MNTSYYFQHDYNSANDAKILYLRQQLGIEGYGIYWFIIEQLAQAGGVLPFKIIPVLAMQIQTTPDKVASVVKNYELFVIENEEFFSVRLMQQLQFRKQLSDNGKDGALKRWGKKGLKQPENSPPISPPNAKERKERKGKKESKEITLPFLSPKFVESWNEWLKYRKEGGFKTTETTITKQLNFLKEQGEENSIKIIDNSISSGWRGLFPLKETFTKQERDPFAW
jgi:hypothetical protein